MELIADGAVLQEKVGAREAEIERLAGQLEVCAGPSVPSRLPVLCSAPPLDPCIYCSQPLQPPLPPLSNRDRLYVRECGRVCVGVGVRVRVGVGVGV